MADQRDLAQIVESFRRKTEDAERTAKRRIAITGVLCVFVAGYMAWIHHGISKLDSDAVMGIARAQLEAKLPELGSQLTTMAMDAAPDLMDQGEAALTRMPSTLRDTVEERLTERTDGLIDEMATKLEEGLSEALDPQIEVIAQSGENGRPADLDTLMEKMRAEYRENAGALVASLTLAYSDEISGVNDYLIHLRTGEDLSERERIQKEIVHASVALRRFYIEPLETVGMTEEVDAE